VDCLVCHEQSGTYKKFPTGAGWPVTEPTVFKENNVTYLPPEYNKVAQSVGLPTRKNCGTCHFFGGGGDAVKHGDLDSSMFKPNKALDVHMGSDGQNFECTRCHSTTQHNIAGRVYATPAATERKSLIQDDLASKITCESCHSSTPHKSHAKANDHTDRVACQSCHIPAFARVNPTKMSWDWSTAGQKRDGKPFMEKDVLGKPSYDSKKGNFVWAKNVQPQYYWYNGSIKHLTVADKIDPGKPVALNEPVGAPDDPNSRIFPFKVHMAKQPYDKVNKTVTIAHLFPKHKEDSDAYWMGFDWNKAIASGMAYAGQPYSGEYDFVETSYVFPTTHMVAPKDNAVSCYECHNQEKSRLAAIGGVYMPGRDRVRGLDMLGWIAVFGALLGVTVHGLTRLFTGGRKEG
jgi:octaheme c-type cytochrome (tetrathionate reductase family)